MDAKKCSTRVVSSARMELASDLSSSVERGMGYPSAPFPQASGVTCGDATRCFQLKPDSQLQVTHLLSSFILTLTVLFELFVSTIQWRNSSNQAGRNRRGEYDFDSLVVSIPSRQSGRLHGLQQPAQASSTANSNFEIGNEVLLVSNTNKLQVFICDVDVVRLYVLQPICTDCRL